jgi:hypothetical protein
MAKKSQRDLTDDLPREQDEWEQDIAKLAQKILKVIEGYTAADAIGAMAIVLKHVASKHRD